MQKNLNLKFNTHDFIIDGHLYVVEKCTPLCRGQKRLTAKTDKGEEIEAYMTITLFKSPNGTLFQINELNGKEYPGIIHNKAAAAEFYQGAFIHYAACDEFGVSEG